MALNEAVLPAAAPGPVAERLALHKPAAMRMVHLHPPFDRYMGDVPPRVLATPSMMSENERVFLYNLVRRYYTGAGRVLDAGIFLGGSTNCFAAAIRENPRFARITAKWPKPVLSLERAVVSSTMPAFFARHDVGTEYKSGDSFADLLEEYVAPCKDLVELRIGDILECGEINDRIEICFLDVLKNPNIAAFAIKQYFPKLIPGRSIVIQQDYFFEGLPFIKTYQEYFSDQFEYVGEVGSSAIFRCIAKVDRAAIDAVVGGLPAEDQIRLASIALQRSIDPTRRFMMAMSKTLLINELEGAEAARGYLEFAQAEFAGEIEPAAPQRLAGPLKSLRKLCGIEEVG
jgi:predicted O-methyltransferase YrrM